VHTQQFKNMWGRGAIASVADAVPDFVGYDLLDATENLIIENDPKTYIFVQKIN